ncbi:hypothetical protein P8452_75407 [Trifolium repens]|nr:hypothetical protein P8452_75407 [Trifolium repens]
MSTHQRDSAATFNLGHEVVCFLVDQTHQKPLMEDSAYFDRIFFPSSKNCSLVFKELMSILSRTSALISNCARAKTKKSNQVQKL